jgi:hypothetical protein
MASPVHLEEDTSEISTVVVEEATAGHLAEDTAEEVETIAIRSECDIEDLRYSMSREKRFANSAGCLIRTKRQWDGELYALPTPSNVAKMEEKDFERSSI